MDGFQTRVTARTCLGFLLLILLQTSAEAQLCVVPAYTEFPENNAIGAVVTDFRLSDGVTPELGPAYNGSLFRIEGNKLIANAVLDREASEILRAEIICFVPGGNWEINPIIIYLTNVNDKPPTFPEQLYELNVSELTPVDTLVAQFAATDEDSPTLYYTLKPESSAFKLQSPTDPNLLVATPLEYHKDRNVVLILEVQDTPVGSLEPTYNDSTTINITITDIDNRQPWFQPCDEVDVDGVVTCHSPGYTGWVVLNKQEPGPLKLKPRPLLAIDGDSGINEEITYSIISGDETGLFEINKDTGNITMLRAADVLGNIVLTVRASQKINIYQFAITTVTISVQEESFHPPLFTEQLYQGVVADGGTMVMDLNNRSEPLRIIATDDDYSAVGGVNPHITYSIPELSAFRILEGYLFMIRDLPEATLVMQVTAIDTTNDESAIAKLEVEVESGLAATTTVATTTTTSNTATTTKGGSVPDGTTTSQNPPSPWTTPPKASTTNPSGPTGPTKPSQTSQGGVTTTSTAQPYTGQTTTTGPPGNTATTSKGESTTKSNTDQGPAATTRPPGTMGSAATGGSSTAEGGDSTASTASPTTEEPLPIMGGYELSDMLALGITLGVLLLICLVVIILLVCHVKRRKQDWKKIYETSVFRSSLGIGSQKDGIQYINTAFQNDYVGEKLGSRVPEEQSKKTDNVYETVQKSSVLIPDILPDNISQASSDKSDNEKEVKPILTKERRSEEGYKAVWFKEDIDPAAKVEVVIIPDRRGNDSEVEDEDAQLSSREEEEDDSQQKKIPRVLFKDMDLESKTGDQTDDSEDEEKLSADL